MKKALACPHCEKWTEGSAVSKRETYPVKGDPISLSAKVLVCSECHQEVFDEELDSRNIATAYASYRRKHNLLSPREIAEIRKKYDLGQRAFSRVLGWGEITVHRYESGAIQDKAHDELLRLVRNPENMRPLAERNIDKLGPAGRDAFKKRLRDLLAREAGPAFKTMFEQLVTHTDVNELSGFMAFDLDKLENMILFFAEALDSVLKTKLNKLLFFADFLSFKESSVSISGGRYLHFQFGPVPENYDWIIGNMVGYEHSIEVNERVFDEDNRVTGEEVVSLVSPDLSVLTETDVRVMKRVVQRFRHFGSAEIARYSHDEAAFAKTNQGDFIPYTYADELSVSLSK